jgi:hypothetical protein
LTLQDHVFLSYEGRVGGLPPPDWQAHPPKGKLATAVSMVVDMHGRLLRVRP